MEISNLPNKEVKVMIKMPNELGRGMDEHKFTKRSKDIKN